jgi:hypothetical protein
MTTSILRQGTTLQFAEKCRRVILSEVRRLHPAHLCGESLFALDSCKHKFSASLKKPPKPAFSAASLVVP